MLLALAARALPGPRTIDDAFITFRYSRNIVEGQGFVYNPGSRVLGTTTPLFTVLLAAISALVQGQEFPFHAMAVSAIADAGTAALLFLLARRLTGSRWMGALLGGLWAIAPMSVTFAVGGMETSVNILWMVGAVWLYIVERPGWMGILAALGVLTRIDAVIWIGPLFAYQLAERWLSTPGKTLPTRVPHRTWLAFAVTLLPWLIFSLLYFGSPFSRSMTAKSIAYVIEPLSALKTFIQTYATPFFEFDTFGPAGAMIGSVTYLMLSLLGIVYARRRLPRLLPFLIYPWLYMAIFSVANPLIFRWYVAPPLPGLMFGIVGGAWSIVETLQKATKWRMTAPILIGVLALLWGGMSIHAWDVHPDHEPDRPAPRMAWHKIELLYQQIGTQLREQYGVTPDTHVASADIGAIGYFSRATIVDTVGLVTPALSRYYPVSPALIIPGQNYVIPPQLIDDTSRLSGLDLCAPGTEQDAVFKAVWRADYQAETDSSGGRSTSGTDMRVYQRGGP
jgi:hypothetical protein